VIAGLPAPSSESPGPDGIPGRLGPGVIELLAREGQCLLDAQRIIDNLRPQRIGSHASVYRILQEL
jgi:hypothetical protein